MENINNIVEQLNLNNQLFNEDIPELDLYVDQVIQLFENKYNDTIRNDEEKVLTKTMINNYAKGKLFFPIKNKKYSKEHVILINLIYQLKGGLSINDIKQTLTNINKKMDDKEFNLESFYNEYIKIVNKNVTNFNNDINKIVTAVEEANVHDEGGTNSEKELLIMSLINMSNNYRRVAEKLVDELYEEKK